MDNFVSITVQQDPETWRQHAEPGSAFPVNLFSQHDETKKGNTEGKNTLKIRLRWRLSGAKGGSFCTSDCAWASNSI